MNEMQRHYETTAEALLRDLKDMVRAAKKQRRDAERRRIVKWLKSQTEAMKDAEVVWKGPTL